MIAIIVLLVLVAKVEVVRLTSGVVTVLWEIEDWSFFVVLYNTSVVVVVVFLIFNEVLEENTFSVTNVFIVVAEKEPKNIIFGVPYSL